MASPPVRHSATAAVNTASTATTGSMNVPSGDAVWVAVIENDTSDVVNSVGDGTNTYNKKATLATANGTIVLYVADDVTGSSALAVTVKTSTAIGYVVVALDIQGAANPSFGQVGSGAHGSYTSGSNVGDSVSPKTSSDLLLLLSGFISATTTGTPSITFNNVGSETLVNSATKSNATAHSDIGGGVYSEDATSTSPTTLNANATVTGSTNNYVVLLADVLAPSSAAVTGEIGLSLDATPLASSVAKPEIGLSLDATAKASSKATPEIGLSLDATVKASSKAAGEIGLRLHATPVVSSKAAAEFGLQLKAQVVPTQGPGGAPYLGYDIPLEAITSFFHHRCPALLPEGPREDGLIPVRSPEEAAELVRQTHAFEDSAELPVRERVVYVDRPVPGGPANLGLLLLLVLIVLALG